MRKIILVAVFILSAMLQGRVVASPDNDGAQKGARDALQTYFRAIAKRDAASLQSVIHSTLIGVEASADKARVEIIDGSDPKKLLPPEGNDDWQGVTVANIDVHVSATHSSVVVATFDLNLPVSDKAAKLITPELLEQMTEEQREQVKKMMEAESNTVSMCAFLAKTGESWKIVAISLPK